MEKRETGTVSTIKLATTVILYAWSRLCRSSIILLSGFSDQRCILAYLVEDMRLDGVWIMMVDLVLIIPGCKSCLWEEDKEFR